MSVAKSVFGVKLPNRLLDKINNNLLDRRFLHVFGKSLPQYSMFTRSPMIRRVNFTWKLQAIVMFSNWSLGKKKRIIRPEEKDRPTIHLLKISYFIVLHQFLIAIVSVHGLLRRDTWRLLPIIRLLFDVGYSSWFVLFSTFGSLTELAIS